MAEFIDLYNLGLEHGRKGMTDSTKKKHPTYRRGWHRGDKERGQNQKKAIQNETK